LTIHCIGKEEENQFKRIGAATIEVVSMLRLAADMFYKKSFGESIVCNR